ncbi:MAG: hypothetical protein K9N55_03815 [Phycisphaerae bacterium]|nr:hypothetical protein [Phycisphaerae bacterium]
MFVGCMAFVGVISQTPLGAADEATKFTLSNGLVEVRIDTQAGTYDLIDVVRSEAFVKDAEVVMTVAPYRELVDVKQGDSEAGGPVTTYHSKDASLRVETGPYTSALGTGRAVTLVSTFGQDAELRVRFVLYPGQHFLDVGWACRNGGTEPVRLRRVSVMRTNQILPACNHDNLKMLNGNSGGAMNRIFVNEKVRAENNMLYFAAHRDRPRSLVLGGLTYADYRKFVESDPGQNLGADVCADDPVGRRIDPGQTYESGDRFYIDGLTDNPFDALETYARTYQTAQGIDINAYTFPSTCMWFLAVKHFGGDTGSVNDTPGSVREMERIAASGFLKYGPMAVRLVPDCYEQNNEQGWWDDEHWRMHGRKERCIVEGGHIKAPYETTEKWGLAIIERGGIPFTYFEPGVRSEDYAEVFPGHMLFNDPHRYILNSQGQRQVEGHAIRGKIYGAMVQESYDYTDADFIRHLHDVYANLCKGGVQGVFYDYPDRAFPARGGMEDRYATATAAYRNVFRIARDGLGPVCYLQERLGIGSDATLGLVDSVRTAGDTNVMRPTEIRKAALRWYKNRRLVNYDMDGKALLRYGARQEQEISTQQRRTILTLSYGITGRLLLTESLRLFSPEALHDLSRVFPFHDTALSARPLDAFVSEFPSVFDFAMSKDWHQLILHNDSEAIREFTLPISGDTAFGAFGLDADKDYYCYDFWHNRFAGRVSGRGSLTQSVQPGEARMLSIHAAVSHPQWISTDRHVMQGYVDLVEKPQWDIATQSLHAVSNVIENEPYRVVIALNGCKPVKARADGARVTISVRRDNTDLADLVIESDANARINWSVTFNARSSL